MHLSVIKIEASKQQAGKLHGNRLLVQQHGFTLVELITIIIIIGIVAVAAAPRFFDRNVFDSRGFHDQVISTVRYAQKTAIAQRRFVCVTFPANNQISLSFGDTNACTGGALLRPSGKAYPLTNNNATFAPLPSDFSFDCLGRPRDMTTPATCGSAAGILTLPRIVTVNNYGTSITVEQETGYVY